jgi:hypothetical protein
MTETKMDTSVELFGVIPRPFTGGGLSFSTCIWFDAIGNKDEPEKVVAGINLGGIQVGTIRQIARNKGYPCKGYVWYDAIECESKAYATQNEAFFNASWRISQRLSMGFRARHTSWLRLVIEKKSNDAWQIRFGRVPVGFVVQSSYTRLYVSYLGFDSSELQSDSVGKLETELNSYATDMFSEASETTMRDLEGGSYDNIWEHLVKYWLDKETVDARRNRN